VTPNGFRRIVLALAGAVEGSHMGHPDFRAANGRIFASLHGDPLRGMAVLTPADQQRFIADAPEVFQPAAGAWGDMGCTVVHLRHADEEQVGEALTLALQLALTKKPSKSKPKAKARPKPKPKPKPTAAPRATKVKATRRRR
jgi:hypothetical protein